MYSDGEWGGVNLVRAVRALRELVAVTAGFPVEVLDRLVMVGRPLGGSDGLRVMWQVVGRAPDVRTWSMKRSGN